MKTHKSCRRSSKRGSALATTLVFATIISVGLAALLPRVLSDWKMTAQTSAHEAAFNLAESGIEEAIWAILEFDEASEWASAGWANSEDGDYRTREWLLTDMTAQMGGTSSNTAPRIRVIVKKATGASIHIVSQGSVAGVGNAGGADGRVDRFVEAQLRRPNPMIHSLVARAGLKFNGRPFFDSYDSREFPYDYSFEINSGDDVTVGSLSELLMMLDLGGATVLGKVVTGAVDDGTDPTEGADVSGDVTWEFNMELPNVIAPNTVGWNTSL